MKISQIKIGSPSKLNQNWQPKYCNVI